MTDAHDQRLTLHIVAHVPEHEPREDDPHYALFHQARARMKRLGLLVCSIGDDYCAGGIELHHTHIEDSQYPAMDFEKVNRDLGLHLTDDEDFARWIQGPGNLEPLCVNHHRTHFGVHVLPQPLWEPLRYRKAGIPAGGEFIAAKDLPKEKP